MSSLTRMRNLNELAAAFARLPYENLTKIIKREEFGASRDARRSPQEVLSDHVRYGTGGTCFSLTSALLHLVRTLGYQAEPILADRRYGQDTHCAILVRVENQPHLLDPGYLIVNPVPLPETRTTLHTGFNRLTLTPIAGGKLELHTVENGRETYRLTYKLQAVESPEFGKVWDESFQWDMMRYPVLTRNDRGKQLYVRGNHFQIRTADRVLHREVSPDELINRIAAEFHIARSVVVRAVSILERRGERFG